jgi:hypothetical protein
VGIERSATHALKIFESEAELGQNLFGERYLNHILSASADCGKLGA